MEAAPADHGAREEAPYWDESMCGETAVFVCSLLLSMKERGERKEVN
jgi:hypothetical protein